MVAIIFSMVLVGSLALVGWYLLRDGEVDRRVVKWLLVIPVGVVVVWLLSGLFVVVPAGNAGVLLRFGKVQASLPDGLNLKLPFIDSVTNMSIQTQLYQDDATAASKDLQDIKTTIAINYRISQPDAGEIYRTLGVDYIKRIGHPIIQETVKEVTARFNAEDMILKRGEVKDIIASLLKERLAQRKVESETINIVNFEFSAEFTKSIEAKVVAAQNALQATNKLEQVKVEAMQAQAEAVGKANAAIASAEGKAKSIEIVTAAQVQANKDIAASLSDNVLRYILIDRLGSDVKVIVVPGGQGLTLGDISK